MKRNSWLLILFVLLFILSSCQTKGSPMTKSADELEKEQAPAYKDTLDFYNHFEKNSSGEDIYPDDFAGGYYSDKDQKFHVGLTSFDNIEWYKKAASKSPNIVFEKQTYSYNELLSLGKELATTFNGNFGGIDEKENKTVLLLKKDQKIDPKKLEQFFKTNEIAKRLVESGKPVSLDILPLIIEDPSTIQLE
ncbi:hypothetical protein [Guggenheimella bovis]